MPIQIIFKTAKTTNWWPIKALIARFYEANKLGRWCWWWCQRRSIKLDLSVQQLLIINPSFLQVNWEFIDSWVGAEIYYVPCQYSRPCAGKWLAGCLVLWQRRFSTSPATHAISSAESLFLSAIHFWLWVDGDWIRSSPPDVLTIWIRLPPTVLFFASSAGNNI